MCTYNCACACVFWVSGNSYLNHYSVIKKTFDVGNPVYPPNEASWVEFSHSLMKKTEPVSKRPSFYHRTMMMDSVQYVCVTSSGSNVT